jgi:hypothetical protein
MNVRAYVRHCYKLWAAVFWHFMQPSRFPYSACKKHNSSITTSFTHYDNFPSWTFWVLTMNAIIVKLYIFYPNIKIIRLKRHYLPLVLLLVLPHWWGDARCREKSASSCFKSRQAPSTWSEPAIFGGFSAWFPFRELIHFVSRIFCVIENHYVHTAKSFSFSGLKLTKLGEIWWCGGGINNTTEQKGGQ